MNKETLKKQFNNALDINNAEHPHRQTAIHIIEEIIEPLLLKNGNTIGLEGEEYYEIEDKLVEIINKIIK